MANPTQDIFSKVSITDLGINLINRANAGEGTLVFTGAEVGIGKPTGTYPENIRGLTNLIDGRQQAAVNNTAMVTPQNTVQIVVTANNKNYPSQILATEVGIWAKIEGDSSSILYAYAYIEDGAINMPAGATIFQQFLLVLKSSLSNSEDITIVFNDSANYVDYLIYNEAMKQKVDGKYFILDSFVKLGIDPKTSDIETICKAIYNFQDTSGEFKGYVPFDVDQNLIGEDKTYPKVDGNLTVNKVDISNQEAVIFACDFESTYGGTGPDDPVRFGMWSAIATYVPSADTFVFIDWQRNINKREMDFLFNGTILRNNPVAIYIDNNNGSDFNSGGKNDPFKTIQAAINLKVNKIVGNCYITLILEDGVYNLDKEIYLADNINSLALISASNNPNNVLINSPLNLPAFVGLRLVALEINFITWKNNNYVDHQTNLIGCLNFHFPAVLNIFNCIFKGNGKDIPNTYGISLYSTNTRIYKSRFESLDCGLRTGSGITQIWSTVFENCNYPVQSDGGLIFLDPTCQFISNTYPPLEFGAGQVIEYKLAECKSPNTYDFPLSSEYKSLSTSRVWIDQFSKVGMTFCIARNDEQIISNGTVFAVLPPHLRPASRLTLGAWAFTQVKGLAPDRSMVVYIETNGNIIGFTNTNDVKQIMGLFEFPIELLKE